MTTILNLNFFYKRERRRTGTSNFIISCSVAALQ